MKSWKRNSRNKREKSKKGVFVNLNDELTRLKKQFSNELKNMGKSRDKDEFELIVEEVIKSNISKKVNQVVENVGMKSQNIKTYKSATLPKEN